MAFIISLICIPFVSADGLDGISTWGIQLHDIDPKKIQNAKHDLVVIDYSRDGTDKNAFSKEEVQQMKSNGKKVLAEINIGEAEVYRFYWNSQWELEKQGDCYERFYNYEKRKFDYKNVCSSGNAGLVGEKDPKWDGKYYAKYWKNEWWDIALSPYLDKIYEAGFDGVYLDGIDAYEYWSADQSEKKGNAEEMAQLIYNISVLSKQKMGGDFLVVPQNGLSLPADVGVRWERLYFSAIDAIAVESLFFDTTSQNRARRMVALRNYAQNDIPLLDLEYSKKKYLKRLQERISDFTADTGISVIPFRAANDEQLNELYRPFTQ